MGNPAQIAHRLNRSICLSSGQSDYEKIVDDASQTRKWIDHNIEHHPELFPPEISKGYRMKDIKRSKKLAVTIRRIEVDGVAYTIRPSFVMPYMTEWTKDAESALFLRKFDVPYWGISQILGKDPMHWHRLENSIGRNSIVGTTVKDPDKLPEHVAADEKHTKILGTKVYGATTVGDECILGASIAPEANEKSLTKAYRIFKDEAANIDPDYRPKTVNLDGWLATNLSWKSLFPLTVIISCILHVFIKIRDRGRKKHKAIFDVLAEKFWDAYHAENKRTFTQRIRRLHEWALKSNVPETLFKPIEKLREKVKNFSKAYDHPGAHRTSNMLDRLMQRMDRRLVSAQYFHGTIESAELGIRAWALIYNFAPSNPRTVKKYEGRKSPAERLNGFAYSESWLENLLVSASLGGYRQASP